MRSKEFMKIIFPGKLYLFDINNFNQIQFRKLNLLEKMILSIANYFSETKISVYEVIFTLGLKISIKPFVQSVMDELYSNNYLELDTNFDKSILEKNLYEILEKVYNFSEENSYIEDKYISKNFLTFSINLILKEIKNIISNSEYLYQYRINRNGINALKKNRIKTYENNGNSQIGLLNINSPNEKLSILNFLIDNSKNSGLKRLNPTEKSFYYFISKILKDKENLLKTRDIDLNFISYNNDTVIEYHIPIENNITFYYNQNIELIKVEIQQKKLKKISKKINEILEDNLNYFKLNQILNKNAFQYLKEKITQLDSDFKYPQEKLKIYKSKIYLNVDKIEELNYVKKFLPKLYFESINIKPYEFEFEDLDYNFKIICPLIININYENNEVFFKFTLDFIYHNYIKDKKILSYKELEDIFSIVHQKYLDFDKNLGKTFIKHHSEIRENLINNEDEEYELYILDKEIESHLFENFPNLLNKNYKIIINTEENPINAILQLGSSEVKSLYEKFPEVPLKITINMKNSTEHIEYEIHFFPVNRKETQKELIK
ncbi:MAG: hypothetical protein ACTSPW_03140, partial [Promethearchaeota archaeon]